MSTKETRDIEKTYPTAEFEAAYRPQLCEPLWEDLDKLINKAAV